MSDAASTTQRMGIPYDVFCQECGYNLRGLTGERCPECGHSLEAARSQESRIPWVHRDKLGRFRAYWRTVIWTSIRYKRFCEEIVRRVDYRDAQRFRWMTILHVYVSVLVATVVWYVSSWPTLTDESMLNAQLCLFWPMAVLHGAFIILLLAATGVPSYFFDVRDLRVVQRNSAIAMSYYCCGVLAWIPVQAAILSVALLIGSANEVLTILFSFLLVVLPAMQLLVWWFDLIHTARRLMPHRLGRAVALAFLTPLLWCLLAVLIFVGIPLSVLSGYLSFVVLG